MIDRGYHIPPVVKHILSLGKRGENKNKWPQKHINSHDARTQHTAQLKEFRTLTYVTCCRHGKDGDVHLCTVLSNTCPWDISVEPGEYRTMMQEIRSLVETPHEE